MKKYLVIFMLAVSLLNIAGCKQVETEPQRKVAYQKIEPEAAKKRLETERGTILLDVRTVAEYKEKHIPGSMLIPVDDIKTQASEKLKDKDAAIFVYCRSGNRSAIAAQTLAGMNYTNVYDLGGINKWPYATEADS